MCWFRKCCGVSFSCWVNKDSAFLVCFPSEQLKQHSSLSKAEVQVLLGDQFTRMREPDYCWVRQQTSYQTLREFCTCLELNFNPWLDTVESDCLQQEPKPKQPDRQQLWVELLSPKSQFLHDLKQLLTGISIVAKIWKTRFMNIETKSKSIAAEKTNCNQVERGAIETRGF